MASYKAMSDSQIVIRSFNDKRAESIFHCRRGKGLPVEIQQRARRKLRMLDAVTVIDDLKIPPSNHLQKLKGHRRGQHSIRINDQWRISFVRQHRWASEIEIVGDYGAGYGSVNKLAKIEHQHRLNVPENRNFNRDIRPVGRVSKQTGWLLAS